MSEPVGNSPRSSGEIQGNSHKDRKEAPEVSTAVEKTPVEKIVVGKVSTRKLPWYKRLGRGLIADDATNIGDYILIEVLIPSLKNLISDAVRGGTDRVLYGSSRPRGRSGVLGRERESLRTRYDKMSSDDEPRRMLSREARATHSFDEVILESHAEAVEVIEYLIDRIRRYDVATVTDLYDACGVTGSYADRSYGWTDLRDADVRQTRGGFLLDLPKPVHIRR